MIAIVASVVLIAVACAAVYFAALSQKASAAALLRVVELSDRLQADSERIANEVAIHRVKAKEVLQLTSRTSAQAKRVLEMTHEQKKNIDLLMGDEKVQAALSKARRET